MIYTFSANPALDLILTVPAIEFEVVLRANEVRREMGGKGFNVSRYLKALGVANVAVAFAGGFTGQALAAGLAAGGVPTEFVYLQAGETRTNVVIQEPNGRRHIKANQPGATVTAGDQDAFWARLEALARPGDLWVLTGSLAPGLAPDFYAEAAERLQAAGAQFVLDTSGPALRRGCAAGPALVKPNVLEAEEFTGGKIVTPQDAAAAAGAFLEAGAQRVILSLGKDGAVAAAGDERLHIQPPAVTVQTAVGAGDAVVAGAVWAIQQGLSLREIGVWGVATGTLTAMHDDLPPNPHAQLAEIAGQVQVSKVRSFQERVS
jgi:1-phosphofructokinase family hexose kinase